MPNGKRIAATAALSAAVFSCAHAMDIESTWDFSDPQASEQRFEAALATADANLRLQLLTQIARTYSLRRRFDDAHRVLDAVEPLLDGAAPVVRVRYLLERGRTLRSSGQPAAARPLFVDAWQLARARGLDGLAVDAAHMVALVEQAPAAQLEWNERALDLARSSAQPYARQWQASLHNNIGWSLHDAGRYEQALMHLQAALRERERQGKAEATRIARWAVARCLRSLGRHDEALGIQRALEVELAAAGKTDGFVFEELAELLALSGRSDEARGYFRRAADELAKDVNFVAGNRERLARLRERAN